MPSTKIKFFATDIVCNKSSTVNNLQYSTAFKFLPTTIKFHKGLVMIDYRLTCVNIGISFNPFSTYFITHRVIENARFLLKFGKSVQRFDWIAWETHSMGSLPKPQISLFQWCSLSILLNHFTSLDTQLKWNFEYALLTWMETSLDRRANTRKKNESRVWNAIKA